MYATEKFALAELKGGESVFGGKLMDAKIKGCETKSCWAGGGSGKLVVKSANKLNMGYCDAPATLPLL